MTDDEILDDLYPVDRDWYLQSTHTLKPKPWTFTEKKMPPLLKLACAAIICAVLTWGLFVW